jgi:hypothetical protein
VCEKEADEQGRCFCGSSCVLKMLAMIGTGLSRAKAEGEGERERGTDGSALIMGPGRAVTAGGELSTKYGVYIYFK